VPLVLAGGYFGFRKEKYKFPVGVNTIARQIPDSAWFLNPLVSSLLAGILPFGAVFIELFFILNAIWENQFYYMFGFLFLVFLVLVISCSEIAIVMTYMQFCAEDYRWWWRSFFVSGGCAIYVFLYSAFYFFTKLEVDDAVPTLLYFTYSAVMSIGFFLMTGAIGFVSTFVFTRRIYGAVKID
jgi:transmembrane 9 superfamily protein 2/4